MRLAASCENVSYIIIESVSIYSGKILVMYSGKFLYNW